MRVEASWGSVVIDGQRYEGDVVVHVDGRVTARQIGLSRPYRDSGELFHVPLSEEELGFISEERPEVIIVGAGFRGMLSLTPRAKEMLTPYETVMKLTPEATEVINKERRRFVAFIHVRC